jgi:hypothetical protein
VLVKMPRNQPAASGGLIVRDSIGGELLQFRTTQAIPAWREVVLFRRVPEDGELTVTLGFSGVGDAYFDDLRVELLSEGRSAPPAEEDEMAAAPGLPEPSLPAPAIRR